ncbi:hypothetical protein LZK73_18435 [Neorhizobium galegae]|nr:hypothetical protein LZK73_18435 [Neorhizobium galegae]
MITPEQIEPVLMQLLQQLLSSGGPDEPQAGFEGGPQIDLQAQPPQQEAQPPEMMPQAQPMAPQQGMM